MSNLSIEIAPSAQSGGNPADPKAVFLSWDKNPNLTDYRVESSTDLNQWVPAGIYSTATLGAPDPYGRYRIELERISAIQKFYRMYGTTTP